MSDERIAELASVGLSHTLEAIKLRGNNIAELKQYIARLEVGGGQNTRSMRRAEKRLKDALKMPKTKGKKKHKD